MSIHECSPAERGISVKLKKECKDYKPSQYYPKITVQMVGDFYNINLENQHFENEIFDIFIALDVMEHVFDPKSAIQEIYRTLKPGGYALLTFPILKSQVEPLKFRATLRESEIEFIENPQYHGNPIDENGSLVTIDYGYDIHQKFSEWARFNVEVVRFNRKDIGILGEFTEVIILSK